MRRAIPQKVDPLPVCSTADWYLPGQWERAWSAVQCSIRSSTPMVGLALTVAGVGLLLPPKPAHAALPLMRLDLLGMVSPVQPFALPQVDHGVTAPAQDIATVSPAALSSPVQPSAMAYGRSETIASVSPAALLLPVSTAEATLTPVSLLPTIGSPVLLPDRVAAGLAVGIPEANLRRSGTPLSVTEPLNATSSVPTADGFSGLSTTAIDATAPATTLPGGFPAFSQTDSDTSELALGDLSQTIIPNPQRSAFGEPGALVHQVRSGETLEQIAIAYHVSEQALIEANALDDPDVLQIDEALKIPAADLGQFKRAALSLPRGIHSPGAAGKATRLTASLTEVALIAHRELGASLPVVTLPTLPDPLPVKERDRSQLISPVRQPVIADRQLADLVVSPTGVIKTNPIQSLPQPSLPRTLPEKSWSQDFHSVRDSRRQPQTLAPTTVASLSGTQPLVDQPSSAANFGIPLAKNNILPQIPRLELPPLAPAETYLPNGNLTATVKFVKPAQGILTSGYGMRWGRMHRGIDIAAPVGTPIIASATGVVVTAGWNSGGYGNLVEIRHPDGSLTLYAHNNRILARVGQEVRQGEKIAEMGSTGRSTGPHVHFEIHPAGKGAVNPMLFLNRG